MLIIIIATLGALLLIGAASWLLRKIWWPLARILWIACAAALTLMTCLSAFLAMAGVEDGILSVVVVGGAVALISARMLLRLLPNFPRKKEGADRQERPIAWEAVHEVDDDWSAFISRLGWSQRPHARRAQASISAFLAEVDSPFSLSAHQTLAIALERRVPELLVECHRRCERATASERRGYLDRTLATLRQLGSEADRARSEVRESDDHKFDTLHRYFSSVTEHGL